MSFFVQRRDGTLIHSSQIAEENGLNEETLSPEVAAQFVRRMDDPESVGDGSFFGDLSEYIEGGIGSIGEGIGGIITMLDPTASGARRRGDTPIGDQLANASRGYRQRATSDISPEGLEAMSRQGWDQVWNDDPDVPPWERPNYRNIGGQSVQSAPLMVPTMGAGVIASGLGAGARTSATVAAGMEGALAGGLVATAIDEGIRDIAAFDPDTFARSSLGREALRETNGDYARAVELAANRAKEMAPLVAGVGTALVGRLGPNWFQRQGHQPIVRAALVSALREGGEEAVQSTQEQMATNYGIGNIDPEVGIMDDVGPAAVLGGITGAGMGATFGTGSQIMERMRPQTQPPQPAGPALQGPVMPPPGTPGGDPASGNGNPPGWVAPDTQNAEDADYVHPGERELGAQPGQAPPRPERPTDQEASPEAPEADPAAAARAAEYASRFDGEEAITDPADDELYAGALAERLQSLGMAAREAPPKKKGVRRTVESVPLYRYNREDLEADDEDAAAIYAGAVERAVADGLDISEALQSTATFGVYSQVDKSLFADETGDPKEAVGYGLKVADSDGTVTYLDIGAKTRAEAEANAGKFGVTKDMESAKPKEAVKPPEAIKPDEPVIEPEAPQTGTDIQPKGPIKNLKPAANEALNVYRTKGEQGLQAYLGGLNVTASKSLLRALGGQPRATDKMNETKGAILQRVRGIARSADARGLPEPSAPTVNDNVSPQDDAANQAVSDKEFFGEDWPANTKDAPAVTEQEQEAPEVVAPEATPKPVKAEPAPEREQDAPERIKPKNTAKRIEDPEVVELKPREGRSAKQIKALLRDIAALDEDAYDAALTKMKITPEEAAAVREAMKTDKGLDNLRSTFNDVLSSQRKVKKSRQTEEPKAKAKPKKTEEEKEVESQAKKRKRQEATDRALAREMAQNQPLKEDVVRRSVEDWLEMERGKFGSDQSWFNTWPIARQEALIKRTWDYVNGVGPMESRKTAPEAERPIQARDVPIKNPVRNRKWTNEMERAIKTAAACAASLGPATLGAGATLVAGLGLGALTSVPIASFLAEEGREATRFNELVDKARQFRQEAGLAPANAYLDEEMNYTNPDLDEEGFVQPSIPDDEVYSQAELDAARRDIRRNVRRSNLITPADIRRQAYIRRYGLQRHITDLNAPPEPREEERIRIPQ